MKPPAFQFYPDDFLGGTGDMTAEEVGAYIRLLCHQWGKGGLPNDPERLARMAGALPVSSLGYVVGKFRLCEDGCLRNDRLEAERVKQTNYRAEQSEKGKKGADARWKNGSGHAPAMPVPQPNDGSPSPSPSPSPDKTERERVEQPETPAARPPTSRSGRKPANLAECLTAAAFVGMSEQDARDWYRDCEACDWMRGDGTPFDHWKRQQCIHRDNLASKRRTGAQRTGAGPSGNERPVSILDLKTVIQAKQGRMDELKAKHYTHFPMGGKWSDKAAQEVHALLRKEVRELSIQLSNRA